MRLWCLLNHRDLFYCKAYPSKKAAKYNLKIVKNSSSYGDCYKEGFFIGQREVIDYD